ncbi:MAG: type II toxin-antitoxin system CcdA family antitoxin [Burkholderiales bacterium]|nr:type II toxin-antitoxin system CcdA family antitoxin [Burkholderiales bacterium]
MRINKWDADMLIYDPAAPKKSANLSVNADLLNQARALDINLSQMLEKHLAETIRQARRAEWLRPVQWERVPADSILNSRLGVFW